MVKLVATEGCGFQASSFKARDVPSLDRKNKEHHPDGSLVSRDHKLACARPGQKHLALESCGYLH